jgi:hypothetical protein
MRSSDEEMEEMRRAYDDVVTRYGLNADATGLGQAAALLKTVNMRVFTYMPPTIGGRA